MDHQAEQRSTETENKFNLTLYLVNTVIQYIIFLLPLIVIYLIWYRNDYLLLHFFGLKSYPMDQWKWILLLFLAQIPMMLMSTTASKNAELNLTRDDRIVIYNEDGFGFKLIAQQMLHILRTAVLEEMMFRGAMINIVRGFASDPVANHVQAIIFTALHVIPLVQQKWKLLPSIFLTILIYAFCYFAGWVMLNPAEGSVLASAISHTLLNWLGSAYIVHLGKKQLSQTA